MRGKRPLEIQALDLDDDVDGTAVQNALYRHKKRKEKCKFPMLTAPRL